MTGEMNILPLPQTTPAVTRPLVVSGDLLKLLTPMEGLITPGQTANAEVLSLKQADQSFQLLLKVTLDSGRQTTVQATSTQPLPTGTNLAITQPSASNLAITVQQAIASSVAILTRIDTAQLPVGTLLQGKVLTSQVLPQTPGQPTVFRSLVSLLNTALSGSTLTIDSPQPLRIGTLLSALVQDTQTLKFLPLSNRQDQLAVSQQLNTQQSRQGSLDGLLSALQNLPQSDETSDDLQAAVNKLLASLPDDQVTRIIGVAKDITEQIEASESLRDSEQRYRMLAESISDVIFSTDSQLTPNYVSPSVYTVLGYEAEWILENGWNSTVANPQQLSGMYTLIERVKEALDDPQTLTKLRTEIPTRLFLFDCLRADGRKIPIELRLVLVWDEQGAFEGVLGVGRDISQQRRAEKDLRMAATVFEHSTSAILITDPAGYIVQANDAFSRVSGYAVAQVLDQLPTMLTVDDQQEAHLAYILKQLHQRGSWEGEVWLKRRSGEHYPAWVGITAVFDDEGDLASYVCFFSDISERKASEQRIHRLAYYDALTHLPNRTLFQDRLHTALQQAERHQAWVVLMFLDLDRFKPINDSLGHAAGDRMLKEMATRLLGCVADDDTVARMGGDEFTLLLPPGATRQVALNRAIHVDEQILASLVTPFVLEGREFFVTASIGIALSPPDGSELSQLMKNADTAMYHAKERGKNNFQFYQADMNASALERLELESDLRHALEQNEFVLYYQPQFSGDGKRLTGAEALLRWRHPRRGLVPPGDFIPVLEELGLVVDVGDWVISEACRQLKTWHENKVRVPKVSVNISARQFSDGQLGERIATILRDTGLPPACLELELTESILMREVNEAMQILASLKNLGLSIAVDDFGTGYSSLNYLKQFPIDVLKIDRTFVDGLPSGEQEIGRASCRER